MEQKPKDFSGKEKQESQPGIEEQMDPKPEYINENYKSSGKLKGKKALITGGDSGISRAVAVHFAREGADVAIVYLDEENTDAEKTKKLIEAEGRKALLIKGDVADPETSVKAVQQTVDAFGGLNILVNNAAQQFPQKDISGISNEQLKKLLKPIFSPIFTSQKKH